jgi:hypothetical protein
MIRKVMIVLGIAGLTATATPILTPASASAAQFTAGDKCSSNFLLFPTWYRGLERKGDTCEIEMSKNSEGKPDFQSFIFIIVLNVIDIALRIVGYAAVGFIIYGGFKYLTSAGSADRITSGRKIIQNALIGLVISFFSVAIVNLIAANIK